MISPSGFFFWVLPSALPRLPPPFQAAPAKVAALRRTVVNTQNGTASRQSGFWGSPPQNFFGLVTARSSKPSQGGALCRRQEPVARSARAEGGGHRRGGRVRGRRGKGTFAVQLAALCEAGTVGPYREERRARPFAPYLLLLLSPFPLALLLPHSFSLTLSHEQVSSLPLLSVRGHITH